MFSSSKWRPLHRLSRINYSTSSQPFPFPKQANPTPYQIFHLSPGASQDEIKNRYYELVRIYHPDRTASSVSSVSSEEAHARFQSISNAYNILQAKSVPNESTGTTSAQDGRYEATTASRRAANMRRHRELYETGAVDDRWKDRIIFFGVVGTVVLFVAQSAMTRKDALEEIMDRARLARLDAERRKKIIEDPRLSALEDGRPKT